MIFRLSDQSMRSMLQQQSLKHEQFVLNVLLRVCVEFFFLIRLGGFPSLSTGVSVTLLEFEHAFEKLWGRFLLSTRLHRQRRELQKITPLVFQIHRRATFERRIVILLDDGPSATATLLDSVDERLGFNKRPG